MGNHKCYKEDCRPAKKWLQLKVNVRAWIYAIAKKEHAIYIERYGMMPLGQDKDDLIDRVYKKIESRDISVPFEEVKNNVGKFISIQNQKSIIPGVTRTYNYGERE